MYLRLSMTCMFDQTHVTRGIGKIQGDLLNMAVFSLVKRDFSNVYVTEAYTGQVTCYKVSEKKGQVYKNEWS